MKLGYRITRAALLLIPAILLLFTHISLSGASLAFGITVLLSAFATMLYLFFHFDKTINARIILEGLSDAFFGLVLFTYPAPDNQFFLIIFSSWIFIMGALLLAEGVVNRIDSNNFWIYILAGITFPATGFVIMNYNPRFQESVPVLIAIVWILYSCTNLYLLLKSKNDIYKS